MTALRQQINALHSADRRLDPRPQGAPNPEAQEHHDEGEEIGSDPDQDEYGSFALRGIKERPLDNQPEHDQPDWRTPHAGAPCIAPHTVASPNSTAESGNASRKLTKYGRRIVSEG